MNKNKIILFVPNVYNKINFENGWVMSEEDKPLVLSIINSAMAVYEEIGEKEESRLYSGYYDRVSEHGVQKEKDLIQSMAWQFSESVQHEIYAYYNDIKIIEFVEKSLLGKR